MKLFQIIILSYFLALPYMGFAQLRDTVVLQLQGRWDDDKLQKAGTQTFSSLWGYTAPDKREYAIIGSLDSIYFIEVTDAKNPVVRDRRAGKYTRCIHREFKTYKNYCYAVADEGPSSLQIYDLKYLPDSVHKVYDSDTLSTRAHNLWMDNDRLYLADNKVITLKDNKPPVVDFYTLTVASLQNPEVPVVLGHLEPAKVNDEYIHAEVHDLFVRNDTAYCSNGNSGLFIYTFTDPANPKLVASIRPPYPQNGYNHSSSLSADGSLLVFADENHYKELKLYNVSELRDKKPVPKLDFITTFGVDANKGSIPHNPFIKGDKIFASYYHDGVVVFDISNPEKPWLYANYDTYWQNDTMQDISKRFTGFEGCWNVYPYFESGTIIASDMTNGLFVLRLDTVPVKDFPEEIKAVNPFREKIQLHVNSYTKTEIEVALYDIVGHICMPPKMLQLREGKQTVQINAENLRNGIYILQVRNGQNLQSFKLIRY